ncbi:TPA: replication regulatory protein RepA [Escherichia coli]|nr:replication regulatory protein RepA [Escherichia coli]HAJ7145498.1 replication regulatory protein RepA [Escherichia coli]HAJ7257746.1 replication regulatory protein RepA [Escherichia coli]HAJ7262577.1 replication regulatory protein RepA [Escherichia coli]HBA2641088.1 replication regulatory protein RepA [Escherichia coli]
MSQTENAVTSSSKEKRVYRKGHPLSVSERQQSFVARKRETHKEIKILVPKELKRKFQEMCAESGLTQAELFSRLIDKAS